MHSNWVNMDRATNNVKTRKAKRVGYPSKFKTKARITVLDSVEAQTPEVQQKAFIQSSPSSPAFAGPKLADVGVTIVLPPNTSDRQSEKFVERTSASATSLHSLKEKIETEGVTTLSLAAAELMFSGLCRNRFLNEPDSPIHELKDRGKEDLRATSASLSSLLETLKTNGQTQFKTPGITMKTPAVTVKTSSSKRKNAQKIYENRISAVRSKSRKEKILLRRAAFVDMCVHTGKLKLAFDEVLSAFKNSNRLPECNILLEPLFCHAVLERSCSQVLNLLSIAEKYDVALSLPSYVICFELLGRDINCADNLKIIRSLVDNMKREGVESKDLVPICHNRPVLLKKVLRAIGSVNPESVKSVAAQSDYHIDVLLPLNDQAQLKSGCYYSPAEGVLSEDVAEQLANEQIDAHSSCIFKISNIACRLKQSEIDELVLLQKETEDEWRRTIAIGLRNSLNSIKEDKSLLKLHYIMECLPFDKVIDIIIQEVHTRLDDSDKQSVGFAIAEWNLGRRIKELYDLGILKKYGILDDAKNAYIKYCKWYLNPRNYPDGPSNPREVWDEVVRGMDFDDSTASFVLREWHSDLYSKIGKFLYGVLLKDVKINENMETPDQTPRMVPALYVLFRKSTMGYQKQLKMHPAVHLIFPTKMHPYLTMSPYELPMVSPPRPWITATSGIYPLSSPALQRHPDCKVAEKVMAKNIQSVPTHELYPCFDSLNQLSSVPWKVNNPVLDVVLEVFNNGGAKELDIPLPPSAAKPEPAILPSMSLEERIDFSKKRASIRQENAAMYSLWCDTLYKLSIAHEFRNRVFWLPHNMDFRGRVYPVCPHLQHMSNDMARSLLIFAKGEKLGPDGLNWLKIHTVNLVGSMSKHSIAERLAHANKVLPKILDSAENPLSGGKWWMKSEYPWQTLAACKEIANAIASEDPENFVSFFPVHQDGSCNGLQHYAALGRDTLGAESVNLVDSDIPADVYMCVADSVEQHRAKAASEGHAIAQKLEGFICRKVVKQTVMTTVYGVTQYGAQMQIRGQLKDLEFPPEMIPEAGAYVSKLIFQSLGEMFNSSRQTQDWLTLCAQAIVKIRHMPVKWKTPLGLPVVQPYFKKMTLKSFVERTQDQGGRFSHEQMPIARKHMNAFSPNFIHSLDSCHMALTGLYCEQANIPFVSIHDCYWVHAKNIPAMSKICREQFVSLHSKPILEDLSEFLIQTYCSESAEPLDVSDAAAVEGRRLRRLLSAVPKKGDFDLNEVLKSKFFFS